MVFYYNDLLLSHKIDDFLIPMLLVCIIILPFLIYFKFYLYSLIISCLLAIIQIIAVIMNIFAHPL